MTRRILRAAGALVALAMLTLGMPVALLAMGGDPRDLLPGAWPAREDTIPWAWYRLRDAWNTGELVFHGLLVMAWLAWLTLMWLTILEVVIQLRHGAAYARNRLIGIGPRRWIGGLVSTILLLGNTAHATTMPPAIADVVASAPHHRGDVQPTSTPAASATPGGIAVAEPDSTTARCPRVTVVPGDTLWGLAGDHLGDGNRFPEIVALNRELLRRGPQHLEIGWVLLLPPDATGVPDPTKTPPCPGDRTVDVNVGDTLSIIAARELGDPGQWKVIFDANVRQPQPDGRALRRPDLILPGWILRIPAIDSEWSAPADNERANQEAAESSEGSDTGQPTAEDGGRRAPEATVDEDRTETPTLEGSDATPEPHPGTGISLPSGAYVSLGLAALITLAATIVWHWRRRTYVPGSSRRDDLQQPPVVRAMRLAYDVATLPRDSEGDLDHRAQPGERPGELGVQDRALATAMSEQPADGHAVVGTADGKPIAVDLARSRGLALTGPGAAAAARALAVDLIAHAFAPDQRAPVLLMPETDAATLLNHSELSRSPRRLRTTSSGFAALDWLEAELVTRSHQATSENPQPLPPLVLIADVATLEKRRLRALLDEGADLGIAAILLGDADVAAGVVADVAADGTVITVSGELDTDLAEHLAGARLFTLPALDTRALLDVLGAVDDADEDANRPKVEVNELEVVADPAEHTGERPPEAEAAAAGTAHRGTVSSHEAPRATDLRDSVGGEGDARGSMETRPVRLCLLGRVHLYYRGQDVIEAVPPKQQELLVHLALHRNGVRRETLVAAIWPDAVDRRAQNAFHVTLSQMRRTLRKVTEESVTDLTVRHDGYYAIDTRLVTVDLWDIQDAVHDSRHAEHESQRHEALRQVVELYRGDLADGLSPAWLHADREGLRRDVLDAISRLIRLGGDNQLDDTLALLERARTLDACNEAIYRDIARVQARLGLYDAIPRTLKLLTDSLADIDEHPTRDSLALMESLQRAAETQTTAPERSRASKSRRAHSSPS